MKARHTAAIALAAGWCLLQPPPSPVNRPNHFAPLKEWTRVWNFSSYDECEGAIVMTHRLSRSPILQTPEALDAAKKWARQQGKVFNPDAVRQFGDWSQCVTSDDPRLKGK
jgi:hypothetical protein